MDHALAGVFEYLGIYYDRDDDNTHILIVAEGDPIYASPHTIISALR